MRITYHRRGGVLAFLTFAAVALAAALFTVAVGAIVLVVVVAVAAVAVAARAVLPARWRRRTVPPAAAWPHDTLEGTVVDAAGDSNRAERR